MSLLVLIDHPKDSLFISGFFAQFLDNFLKQRLFHQVYELLSVTTDKHCIIEIARFIAYMYNCLKFRNHLFSFVEYLEKERTADVLLSPEALRHLVTLTVNASPDTVEFYTLALISIVKYARSHSDTVVHMLCLSMTMTV